MTNLKEDPPFCSVSNFRHFWFIDVIRCKKEPSCKLPHSVNSLLCVSDFLFDTGKLQFYKS